MDEITKLLTDPSFKRWISGCASSSEIAKWAAWSQANPSNEALKKEALKIQRFSTFATTCDSSDIPREWRKLSRRLSLGEATLKRQAVQPTSVRWRRRSNAWRTFGAIGVAVLLIVVARNVSLRFNKQETALAFQEIRTEYGQRVTLSLPDGSKIILNANSTLTYPVLVGKGPARFQLQGEAYFQVAPRKNPENKFIVETNDGAISVIGTRFAIYKRGSGTRVVVAKGLVEVAANDSSGTGYIPDIFLKPGFMLNFRKGTRLLSPSPVNIEPYTSWWKKHLTLVKTPFSEVAQRLEDTYGVDVVVADRSLLKRTLSGSIENYNLVVITNALAEALRVPVSRNGKRVIFGSSSK